MGYNFTEKKESEKVLQKNLSSRCTILTKNAVSVLQSISSKRQSERSSKN